MAVQSKEFGSARKRERWRPVKRASRLWLLPLVVLVVVLGLVTVAPLGNWRQDIGRVVIHVHAGDSGLPQGFSGGLATNGATPTLYRMRRLRLGNFNWEMWAPMR